MSLGMRDVWPSKLDEPEKPSLNDVIRTLRQVQALEPSGSVLVDGVRWEPSCRDWSCQCATPGGPPCREWMGSDHAPRCARCGWPEHRHDARMRVRFDPETHPAVPWEVYCSTSACRERFNLPWRQPRQPLALFLAREHYRTFHS